MRNLQVILLWDRRATARDVSGRPLRSDCRGWSPPLDLSALEPSSSISIRSW